MIMIYRGSPVTRSEDADYSSSFIPSLSLCTILLLFIAVYALFRLIENSLQTGEFSDSRRYLLNLDIKHCRFAYALHNVIRKRSSVLPRPATQVRS